MGYCCLQLKAASSLTQMGSFLKSQSSGGAEDQEVIETAATSVVSGLSNIMGAAAVTAPVAEVDGGNNGTQNTNKVCGVQIMLESEPAI